MDLRDIIEIVTLQWLINESIKVVGKVPSGRAYALS